MKPEYFNPPRNFAAIPPPYCEFDTARAVVIPVPYDSTVDWKSGARDGPHIIVDASGYLELYDQELDMEISRVGIHTLSEVRPSMEGPEGMVERVYLVARSLLAQGKLPVMLGGEHSLTLGMVRACAERYPGLSVLQLDAHADLRDEYQGTKYSHATVMRRVMELCPLVQVGLRSLSLEESQFIAERKLKPFFADGLSQEPAAAEAVASRLSSQVYITIDLDVLDPSIMAAVGTPEPGGLTWQQVLGLLRSVARGHQIVGFDLVEFCPQPGAHACALLAAKLAYKLIGYATRSPLA